MPRHYQHDVRPIFRDWLAARGLPRPASEPPLRATESKWPKEIKPLLIQVLRDLAILRRAAEVLSEPIYVASDDIADFFSQLGLSTPTLPLMNIHFISLDDMLAAQASSCKDPSRSSFKRSVSVLARMAQATWHSASATPSSTCSEKTSTR